MYKQSIKYTSFSLLVILASFICIFMFSSNALAWTTTDWRPSIEVKKNIDSISSRINEAANNLEYSTKFIEEYEENHDIYEKKVNDLKNVFEGMNSYVQKEKPELEEIIKKSYAACLAKDLLDEIIGTKLITDGLFHWGFITFVTGGEWDEVLNFIDSYYQTKNDLENAINERDNADNIYKQSLINIESIPNELSSLNCELEYYNNLLPQILEIENVYGAAGESRIEGTNMFCHPCPNGQISSPFGSYRSGYVHLGCDFSADWGSPIYAAADGIVVETGTSASMGNYFKIDHGNGLVTIYMHCSHIYVPANMHVCKGDNVALVGSTGDSTGPHLHFQVELNGTPVNGLNYM